MRWSTECGILLKWTEIVAVDRLRKIALAKARKRRMK